MPSVDDNARVKLPTEADVQEFQHDIAVKYPLFEHVYAVADGLKFRLQASGRSEVQNMFYNGWTHGHYVSCVFVFAPARTVVACAINAHGCVHDSQLAAWGGVYAKLESLYALTGGHVVVDSAFSKNAYSFLIKSGSNIVLPSEKSKQAISLRQSAEWGMRKLQAVFPHLKGRLQNEENGERKCIRYSFVLLFNLRSNLVGLNQILSTFYSACIERSANDIF